LNDGSRIAPRLSLDPVPPSHRYRADGFALGPSPGQLLRLRWRRTVGRTLRSLSSGKVRETPLLRLRVELVYGTATMDARRKGTRGGAPAEFPQARNRAIQLRVARVAPVRALHVFRRTELADRHHGSSFNLNRS